MQSTILITPISNIQQGKVLDNNKIEKRTYDTNMDVHTFHNTKTQTNWRGNLMYVSIYEDLIVEKGTDFKILQMLSK